MDEKFGIVAGINRLLLQPQQLKITLASDDGICSLAKGDKLQEEPIFTAEFNPSLSIKTNLEMELIHTIVDTGFREVFAAVMQYLQETQWRAPIRVVFKGGIPIADKEKVRWAIDNYANRERISVTYSGIY